MCASELLFQTKKNYKFLFLLLQQFISGLFFIQTQYKLVV